MKNPRFPNYQSVIRLSLSVGGLLQVACLPALANPISEKLSADNAERTSEQLVAGASLQREPYKQSRQKSKDSPLLAGQQLLASEGRLPPAKDRLRVAELHSSELNLQPMPSSDTSARFTRSLALPARDNADGHKVPLKDISSASNIASDEAVLVIEPDPADSSSAGAMDVARLAPQIAHLELDNGLLAGDDDREIALEPNSPSPQLPDLLTAPLLEANQSRREGEIDPELGRLRLQQERSGAEEELGILRLLQTVKLMPPPAPKQPIAFLAGRLGWFDTENAFRTDTPLDDQISQGGLTFYLFPKLSSRTNLYAIAETNLARYAKLDAADYNEIELQLGIRQRLLPRTFAQLGWRNQRLYQPGYREDLLNIHYIDALLSHRSILSSRSWLDSFYQARLGFADRDDSSRFRQTFTLSLNYGITQDLRTSLLYQLDFDDYTEVARYDTYQQILGILSYNLTPESRLSFFGGTRFGRSSRADIDLNDTFYGAGLNVSVPLF